MHITIIQVGKTKHQFVQQAEQEYLKRLGISAKVNIITLREASEISTSDSSRESAKSQEAGRILEAIPDDSFVVALDEHGKQFTSVEFARFIEKNRDFEGGDMTFIIGGPFGLHQRVLERTNLTLSFSRFTFTHEMIRMLLLEQLYRAFTIITQKTYHY